MAARDTSPRARVTEQYVSRDSWRAHSAQPAAVRCDEQVLAADQTLNCYRYAAVFDGNEADGQRHEGFGQFPNYQRSDGVRRGEGVGGVPLPAFVGMTFLRYGL